MIQPGLQVAMVRALARWSRSADQAVALEARALRCPEVPVGLVDHTVAAVGAVGPVPIRLPRFPGPVALAELALSG